jgi:hypothetical protein
MEGVDCHEPEVLPAGHSTRPLDVRIRALPLNLLMKV